MNANTRLALKLHRNFVCALRLHKRLLLFQLVLLLFRDHAIDATERCIDTLNFFLKLAVEFSFFLDSSCFI